MAWRLAGGDTGGRGHLGSNHGLGQPLASFMRNATLSVAQAFHLIADSGMGRGGVRPRLSPCLPGLAAGRGPSGCFFFSALGSVCARPPKICSYFVSGILDVVCGDLPNGSTEIGANTRWMKRAWAAAAAPSPANRSQPVAFPLLRPERNIVPPCLFLRPRLPPLSRPLRPQPPRKNAT